MLERFRAFWTKPSSPRSPGCLIRLGVSPDAVTIVGTLGVCAGALVFFPSSAAWPRCSRAA
jgi:CDP-diacylglycerol--glycerol-3-phosphate 3-phosphatidyltransferase